MSTVVGKRALALGSAVVLGLVGTMPSSASAAPPAAGDVVVVTPLAGGITKVTIYTPAAGVTSADLASSLKLRGEAAVVQPLDAFQCYYGTAYALQGGKCPPIRWSGTRPTVYYSDFSSAAWPMTDVVPLWNHSPDIDVWWRATRCDTHCVTVLSANYGATKWAGLTTYNYLTVARTFVEGSVYMQLNDYYSDTYAERRNAACHEAGHAIGVDHNLSKASCMYNAQGPAQNPASDDTNLLTKVIY